jgi:hypothetical protein
VDSGCGVLVLPKRLKILQQYYQREKRRESSRKKKEESSLGHCGTPFLMVEDAASAQTRHGEEEEEEEEGCENSEEQQELHLFEDFSCATPWESTMLAVETYARQVAKVMLGSGDRKEEKVLHPQKLLCEPDKASVEFIAKNCDSTPDSDLDPCAPFCASWFGIDECICVWREEPPIWRHLRRHHSPPASQLLSAAMLAVSNTSARSIAVLLAEGGACGREAPRKVLGYRTTGPWVVSYASDVLPDPPVAYTRLNGLLEMFKSKLREPLPQSTTIAAQWMWSLVRPSSYEDIASQGSDGESDEAAREVVLGQGDSSPLHEILMRVKSRVRDSCPSLPASEAVDGLDLCAQWWGLPEGAVEETQHLTTLDPEADRRCRWRLSARWVPWASAGVFGSGAARLLDALECSMSLHKAGLLVPHPHGHGNDLEGTDAFPVGWLESVMSDLFQQSEGDEVRLPKEEKEEEEELVGHQVGLGGRSLWTWVPSNGSPIGRIFSLLSCRMATIGGWTGAAALWVRFVKELRVRWEDLREVQLMKPYVLSDGRDMLDPTVNGQDASEQYRLRDLDPQKATTDTYAVNASESLQPDLRLGSISQRIMLMNCCIAALRTCGPTSGMPRASGSGLDTKEEETGEEEQEEDGEFFDAQPCEEDETGISFDTVIVPPSLEPLCPLTDETAYAQATLAPHLQRVTLTADMFSFLSCNPGVSASHFRKWYGLPKELGAHEWDTALRAQRSGRFPKPLFDAAAEAEKALHYLETISPAVLCTEAMMAFLSTAEFVLLSDANEAGIIVLPGVAEVMQDLRSCIESAASSPLGSMEPYQRACDVLGKAEGVVTRASALAGLFPLDKEESRLVVERLATTDGSKHVAVPRGLTGLPIRQAIWGRDDPSNGSIELEVPPPCRRDYIFRSDCSLTAPGLTQVSRMHAIVLEPSADDVCRLRVSVSIPEPQV